MSDWGGDDGGRRAAGMDANILEREETLAWRAWNLQIRDEGGARECGKKIGPQRSICSPLTPSKRTLADSSHTERYEVTIMASGDLCSYGIVRIKYSNSVYNSAS